MEFTYDEILTVIYYLDRDSVIHSPPTLMILIPKIRENFFLRKWVHIESLNFFSLL